MIAFIKLCFFLIMASVIPLTAFSLTAADFDKKIAAANQMNLPSPPSCNCPNTNTPTYCPTPAAAAPSAPLYYAPPINANPAAPAVQPASPPSSDNNSLWGAKVTPNSPPLIIGY